jgi:hypothetical protein
MAVAESIRHREARYHCRAAGRTVRAKLFRTVAASFEQGGDAANLKELCLKAPGQGAASQIGGRGELVPQKSREMGADDSNRRAKKKLGVESEKSDTSNGRQPLHSWATPIPNKPPVRNATLQPCNLDPDTCGQKATNAYYVEVFTSFHPCILARMQSCKDAIPFAGRTISRTKLPIPLSVSFGWTV